MGKQSYQYLLGKSKNQIIEELGEEFNFFPSDVWTYIVHTNWFGRKKVLIIIFIDNLVTEVLTKVSYGKIKMDNWI